MNRKYDLIILKQLTKFIVHRYVIMNFVTSILIPPSCWGTSSNIFRLFSLNQRLVTNCSGVYDSQLTTLRKKYLFTPHFSLRSAAVNT